MMYDEYRGRRPKDSSLESRANSLIVNPHTEWTGTAAPTLHSLRRDSPLRLLFSGRSLSPSFLSTSTLVLPSFLVPSFLVNTSHSHSHFASPTQFPLPSFPRQVPRELPLSWEYIASVSKFGIPALGNRMLKANASRSLCDVSFLSSKQ